MQFRRQCQTTNEHFLPDVRKGRDMGKLQSLSGAAKLPWSPSVEAHALLLHLPHDAPCWLRAGLIVILTKCLLYRSFQEEMASNKDNEALSQKSRQSFGLFGQSESGFRSDMLVLNSMFVSSFRLMI